MVCGLSLYIINKDLFVWACRLYNNLQAGSLESRNHKKSLNRLIRLPNALYILLHLGSSYHVCMHASKSLYTIVINFQNEREKNTKWKKENMVRENPSTWERVHETGIL
jgi:hypothetical protein